MKNIQQNTGIVITIIIGLVLVGGGTYIYLNKTHEQKGDDCINYAKNVEIKFDIVFGHGSNFGDVNRFADDFKAQYPRTTIEKVSSETDFINYHLEVNKGSLYTENQRADYKKTLEGEAQSSISIKVPVTDLGTKEGFDSFISLTLKKYPSITFRQYAGSSPETSLDPRTIRMYQQAAEKQCDYKEKQSNEPEKSAQDIKNANSDSLIRTLISSTRVGAAVYHDDNNSYGNGSLSPNNGLCSYDGINGIKKQLDAIKEKAGVVYCYASTDAYAVSAPLKSNPATGYCSDSTGFYGDVPSPTAASKGYCNVPPPEKRTDISSCQNRKTARERWVCVGDIIDPRYRISDLVGPYAKPNADKINSCKTFTGIEADYCFASIVKSKSVSDLTQEGVSICAMVSNKNPWFKSDCTEK